MRSSLPPPSPPRPRRVPRGIQRSATVAVVSVALAALMLSGLPLPGPGPFGAAGPAPSGLAAPTGSMATLRALERAMGLASAGPLPYREGTYRPAAGGTTYYVANTGSDTAPCTLAQPCRQISEALALVSAGDVIQVSNGTFLGFDVNTLTGTPSAPIVIVSPGRGSVLVPTVNRSDNRDTVHIEYSDWIVLDGFQSYDANRAAVRIDTSDNVTVSNCTFGNDTTWGIFTDFDHDSVLEHNDVYGSVQQHGIYVSNSPIAPVLRWNVVHNNSDAGIQINADATQGGWGIESGGDIEDNVIYSNGASGAAGLNFDGVWNTRVVNNLIYDEHATGIVNYVDDGAAGPHGMVIEDNTVVLASNGRWDLQFLSSTGENYVRDNILDNLNAAHGGLEFGNETDVNDTSSDYNVLAKVTVDSSGNIYTLAQWQALGYEPHSLMANSASLFVDPSAGDYQLLPSAPAIGAGVFLANVSSDLLGNPRPAAGPYDIGCYQYVSPVLTAYAQANRTGGAVSLAVSFTGSATGGTSPYTYTWSFGDASPVSHATDPSHTYNATGTFPVELSVVDAASAQSHAFLNVTVTAAPPPPLVAALRVSRTTGPAPLVVFLNSSATGGTPSPTFWLRFGDLTGSSHAASAVHTYNTSGTFIAELVVNDSAGQTAMANATLDVLANSPPPAELKAAALASPAGGTVPITETFNGSATGGVPAYTFSWSFGDGTPVVEARNPSHTYADAGTFTATLWVTDAVGDNATSTVEVTAERPALTVQLGGASNATEGQLLQFWARATGGNGAYAYSWNFGDGTGWSAPSSSNTSSHTYDAPGDFSVRVWVNDTAGESSPSGAWKVAVQGGSSPNVCGSCSPTPSYLLLAAFGAVAVAVLLAVLGMRRRRRSPPAAPLPEPVGPTPFDPGGPAQDGTISPPPAPLNTLSG